MIPVNVVNIQLTGVLWDKPATPAVAFFVNPVASAPVVQFLALALTEFLWATFLERGATI